jgi:hypothetical protein
MDGGPADLGAKLVMARERRDTTTGLRDAFILYDKGTDYYHLAVYLISRCFPPPRRPSRESRRASYSYLHSTPSYTASTDDISRVHVPIRGHSHS